MRARRCLWAVLCVIAGGGSAWLVSTDPLVTRPLFPEHPNYSLLQMADESLLAELRKLEEKVACGRPARLRTPLTCAVQLDRGQAETRTEIGRLADRLTSALGFDASRSPSLRPVNVAPGQGSDARGGGCSLSPCPNFYVFTADRAPAEPVEAERRHASPSALLESPKKREDGGQTSPGKTSLYRGLSALLYFTLLMDTFSCSISCCYYNISGSGRYPSDPVELVRLRSAQKRPRCCFPPARILESSQRHRSIWRLVLDL